MSDEDEEQTDGIANALQQATQAVDTAAYRAEKYERELDALKSALERLRDVEGRLQSEKNDDLLRGALRKADELDRMTGSRQPTTDQARLDRVAAGTATPEDRQWYHQRYRPHGG